jgi:hypothetical protein
MYAPALDLVKTSQTFATDLSSTLVLAFTTALTSPLPKPVPETYLSQHVVVQGLEGAAQRAAHLELLSCLLLAQRSMQLQMD